MRKMTKAAKADLYDALSVRAHYLECALQDELDNAPILSQTWREPDFETYGKYVLSLYREKGPDPFVVIRYHFEGCKPSIHRICSFDSWRASIADRARIGVGFSHEEAAIADRLARIIREGS